jgi:hypothetical protein
MVVVLSRCAGDRFLESIAVSPQSPNLNTIGEKVQFTAMGNFNQSPKVVDITKQVTWASSNQGVATIDETGMATAVGFGTTEISATATGAGFRGATVRATAASGGATLTAGANIPVLTIAVTGPGVVTSNPVIINCTSGPTPGVCSASFTLGTQVTLTETPNAGATFVLWSGCDTIAGNTCIVTMNNFRTVTATFQ